MAGKPQGPRVNLVGQKFGRLLVLELIPERTASNKIQWGCLCDCGTKRAVVGADLTSGTSKSCGCLQREIAGTTNLKHGKGNTRGEVDPLYRTWLAMRNRCQNPRSQDWPLYGGRGISVCDRWDDFALFAADMGPKPTPKHSIDRINSNGNYEPANCRWATVAEQHANRRPHARQQAAVIDGVNYPSLRQAAAELGMCRKTIKGLLQ